MVVTAAAAPARFVQFQKRNLKESSEVHTSISPVLFELVQNSQFTFCDDCECLDCTYEGSGDDCVDSFAYDCYKNAWAGDG